LSNGSILQPNQPCGGNWSRAPAPIKRGRPEIGQAAARAVDVVLVPPGPKLYLRRVNDEEEKND
jgi:hypothetical protein